MEAGANAFISKPLFASTLYNSLISVVDNEPSNGLTENGETGSIGDFTGKRFLLVEDNDLNGEIATELLTVTGAAIEWAHDGQEAVDMFMASGEGYYDLVLMDIQMPRMNGYEATRTIRSGKHPDAQTIPIFAMTADAFSEDVAAAKASGMNGHIAKPIDASLLYRILEDTLRENRPTDDMKNAQEIRTQS